jgi:hypothetical protein
LIPKSLNANVQTICLISKEEDVFHAIHQVIGTQLLKNVFLVQQTLISTALLTNVYHAPSTLQFGTELIVSDAPLELISTFQAANAFHVHQDLYLMSVS